MRTVRGLAGLAFVAAFAAACSSGGGATPSAAATAAPTAPPSVEAPSAASVAPSPSADACALENLALKTAGKLTIGADNPAYPPYFEPVRHEHRSVGARRPDQRQGLRERRRLRDRRRSSGFAKDEVTWIVAPLQQRDAPGPKDFDIVHHQVSYSRRASPGGRHLRRLLRR